MLARTGTEAGGNEDFRRGGRGVSPYPRRIQRPLKSITAPAAKYCMGRCKVLHRTLKTCSSAFLFQNCLIIGMLPYCYLMMQRYKIKIEYARKAFKNLELNRHLEFPLKGGEGQTVEAEGVGTRGVILPGITDEAGDRDCR